MAASAFGVIVGASSAYAGGITPPVAVWHFDEASGSTVAVDATGHNHNGTLKNVVIRPAFIGNGYYFNGTSAKVVVPYASSLSPGSQNVSISMVFNSGTASCPPAPADCDLWKHGASPGPRTKVEVLNSGMVDCGFAGSNNHIDLVGGPTGGVADGQWHRIECVKTATQVRLLVDNTNVKSSNVVIGDIILPTTNATIGASGGSDWTTGLIDEVTVVYSPAQ